MKKGWEIKKLGEVCVTSAGGTPLKTNKAYYENGDIPWLMSGEVCRKYITDAEKRITKLGMDNSSAKLFGVNTVVVAVYGATAGQVGILKFETTTNQAVCGIFPNKNILPELLYYLFLSYKSELVAQAIGNAQPNISQQKIKDAPIPVPPLSEQERIVETLNALSAQCKQLEANCRTTIAECDALKQAILREAFNTED